MIYRLLIGTLWFNNFSAKELTRIFQDCMETGVSEVKEISHFIIIIFNNGIKIKFWDANHYYAWMSQGEVFNLIDNKKIYTWYDSRPSAKIMYKMKKLLKEYKGGNIKSIDLGSVHSVFDTIKNSNNINKVYSEIKNFTEKNGNFSVEKK